MSPADDGWDLADEVEARKAIDTAVAFNDDLLRSMPYPKFRAKTCADGAHYMRRDAAGLRAWQCVTCGQRRPFHVRGDS